MSGNQNKQRRNQQRGETKAVQQVDEAALVETPVVETEQEAPVAQPEAPEAVTFEEKAEQEANPDSTALRYAKEYVDLMGPEHAPSVDQIAHGVRLLETLLEHIFNGGTSHAELQSVLPEVLTYMREHKATFKAGRMMRGVSANYRVEAQRRLSAYITVLERLIKEGSQATLPQSNLQIMLGEDRTQKLRASLSNILRVKFI